MNQLVLLPDKPQKKKKKSQRLKTTAIQLARELAGHLEDSSGSSCARLISSRAASCVLRQLGNWLITGWSRMAFPRRVLFHVVSPPPACLPGLINIALQDSKRNSGSIQSPLRLRFPTTVLLPHSTGQRQSQGQPRRSGLRKSLHLLMGRI